MGVTTMKITSLRIFGALLVLGVLWVSVPDVRADDDYVTEINRYVDQIYQDQKDRDDYLNSIYQDATQLRDARWDSTWSNTEPAAPVAAPQVKFTPQPVPQDPDAFAQMVRQNRERVQHQIMQGQQQIMQQAGWVAAPQAVPLQVAMPQDPVAFQQMVLQNQERVRQQIMQTRQQILQRSQEIIQQHQL
jgi:hypothetical protein